MESMRKIQDQCQREKEEALRLLDRVKRECEDIIANEKRQCAHEIEMTKRSHESDMQNVSFLFCRPSCSIFSSLPVASAT